MVDEVRSVHLPTVLHLHVPSFQKQRAALLAVLSEERPLQYELRHALTGLQNLLDHIADAVCDEWDAPNRPYSEAMDEWFADGCVAVGLGDPREA